MHDQSFRLPPLNALRVFWAVMRKGSFRSAADDLLVTPQAVSQQVKLLEDILAVQLFERKGRVVEPTEAAIVLSHFVEAGFEEIRQGIKRVTKGTYRNRININVSPYFATRYLMRRLDRFRKTLPGVDLRMTTIIETPDFARDEVDVGIQWGFGRFGGYDATLLVRDPKVLCCTPELARSIRTPSDLLGQTLLYAVLSHELWKNVLRHLGVTARTRAGVIEFHDAATLRRAAHSGIGVGLISTIDALRDIRDGKLVAPFGTEALTDMPKAEVPGFFLVTPRSHRRVETIAAFCDWITSEDWDALT
ncbi:LysR substrate-binding domain-containing protein [Vannielia litorea]|uniref:LysR family transcriptional regulator, glycine cleavage system transcriptional activator n=1 Tax=Vannielia litorea TaxID=1217970 RepID=A0A1N6GH05_9RHOB|nr:LysR substrate-binding domain-containing protein [Vannielia litorea]SIO06803.1 LysR family transcriptional regulator, glycine cleavage system transcriptional activator [Vannielia litorea]